MQHPGLELQLRTAVPCLTAAAAFPPCAACAPPAVPHLLAQRDAISNWAEFSSLNNVTGWNATAPLCSWTFITCNPDEPLYSLCALHGRGHSRMQGQRAGGTVCYAAHPHRHLLHSLPVQEHSRGGKVSVLQPPGHVQPGSRPAGPTISQMQKLGSPGFVGQQPDGHAARRVGGARRMAPAAGHVPRGEPAARWVRYRSLRPGAAGVPALAICVSWRACLGWGLYLEGIRNAALLLCAGPLPDAWAQVGAFPNTSTFSMYENAFTGTLPLSWAGPEAFPLMREM